MKMFVFGDSPNELRISILPSKIKLMESAEGCRIEDLTSPKLSVIYTVKESFNDLNDRLNDCLSDHEAIDREDILKMIESPI